MGADTEDQDLADLLAVISVSQAGLYRMLFGSPVTTPNNHKCLMQSCAPPGRVTDKKRVTDLGLEGYS